jgi:hypothetical protein
VCFSGWNTYQKEAPVPGAGITLLPASVLKSHNKCGGSMYSKCTCTRQLALCVNVKKSFKASFLPFVDFLLEQCWYFLMVTSRRIELEIVFSWPPDKSTPYPISETFKSERYPPF